MLLFGRCRPSPELPGAWPDLHMRSLDDAVKPALQKCKGSLCHVKDPRSEAALRHVRVFFIMEELMPVFHRQAPLPRFSLLSS